MPGNIWTSWNKYTHLQFPESESKPISINPNKDSILIKDASKLEKHTWYAVYNNDSEDREYFYFFNIRSDGSDFVCEGHRALYGHHFYPTWVFTNTDFRIYASWHYEKQTDKISEKLNQLIRDGDLNRDSDHKRRQKLQFLNSP